MVLMMVAVPLIRVLVGRRRVPARQALAESGSDA
jgi:hypothetical protein